MTIICFVVRADEKLTAFMEIESAISGLPQWQCGPCRISPELTGQVVPKNSHGSGMRYYMHPAIATYEVIFA
jgi:hypothetical protein